MRLQVAGSASLEGWDGGEGWAPFLVSSVLPQAGVWLRLRKVSTLLSVMLTMSHLHKQIKRDF